MKSVYTSLQARRDKSSSEEIIASNEFEPTCVCGHELLSHRKSKSCKFVYKEHEQVLNGKPVTITIRCGCRRFEAKMC